MRHMEAGIQQNESPSDFRAYTVPFLAGLLIAAASSLVLCNGYYPDALHPILQNFICIEFVLGVILALIGAFVWLGTRGYSCFYSLSTTLLFLHITAQIILIIRAASILVPGTIMPDLRNVLMDKMNQCGIEPGYFHELNTLQDKFSCCITEKSFHYDLKSRPGLCINLPKVEHCLLDNVSQCTTAVSQHMFRYLVALVLVVLAVIIVEFTALYVSLKSRTGTKDKNQK